MRPCLESGNRFDVSIAKDRAVNRQEAYEIHLREESVVSYKCQEGELKLVMDIIFVENVFPITYISLPRVLEWRNKGKTRLLEREEKSEIKKRLLNAMSALGHFTVFLDDESESIEF